jgi:TrmH family RNA methyltransferase
MTVLLSPGCAEIYNPKTLRASMGAMFHLNIVSENFYENITYLKNRGESVFAADMKGKDIYKAEIPNGIIIFSNEADGPSDKLKKIITGSLTIPKFGKIESLNVASASAVILSEAAKRIN